MEFVGEFGSDTGGLKREFFRLLTRSMAETYMDATGCFQHNSVALQVLNFLAPSVRVLNIHYHAE